MFRKLDSRSRGFTLIEMLLAVSIFVIATLVLIEIYVINQKTQEKTMGTSILISEARNMMEAMVRRMRTGTIDYSYYGSPISNVVNELAILDAAGNHVIFKKGTAGDAVCSGTVNCVAFSSDNTDTYGGSSWARLTLDDINVLDLDFYVHPASISAAGVSQPYVMMVVTLQTLSAAPAEQETITIQTSASSRDYQY